MTIPVMVVLVVFMLIIGALIILQQVKGFVRSSRTDTENAQLRAALAELEVRVQTLERIATDEKEQLKRNINAL